VRLLISFGDDVLRLLLSRVELTRRFASHDHLCGLRYVVSDPGGVIAKLPLITEP